MNKPPLNPKPLQTGSHQTSIMSNNMISPQIMAAHLEKMKLDFHPLVIRSKYGDKEFANRSVLIQQKQKIGGVKGIVEISKSGPKCFISVVRNLVFEKHRSEMVLVLWEKQLLKAVNMCGKVQSVQYNDAMHVPVNDYKQMIKNYVKIQKGGTLCLLMGDTGAVISADQQLQI